MRKFIAEHMFQDQNVTYVNSDNKLHYVELDKLLRVKHFCCRSPKLPVFQEVDGVYRDDIRNNVYKSRRIISERFDVYPNVSRDLLLCYRDFLDGPDKARLYEYVTSVTNADVRRYDHQANHVLPIVVANNLDECLCVSIDGQGDGNLAVFTFANNELTSIHREVGFSFGEFYESIAAYFVSNNVYSQGVEGKFMAFAGLGKLTVTDGELEQLFSGVHDFNWNSSKRAASEFVALRLTELVGKHDAVDVAMAVQQRWVTEVLTVLSQFRGYSRKLVFSGGCALNCVLNQALVRTSWFDAIYWSPVASDSGQSIGAACAHMMANGETPVVNWRSMTRGVDDDASVVANVKQRMVKLDVERILDVLVDDGLVGVVRGNVEPGPRALGCRSILASPLTKSTAARLNAIKGRESYRPYGLVVPREHVTTVVDLDVDAPFMNITGNVVGNVPAATHVDGSTRIQTVTEHDDPWLHALITAFGDRTGVYALINTSFNDSGLPTFNYIADAKRMFDEKLDALVFDDGMAVKL